MFRRKKKKQLTEEAPVLLIAEGPSSIIAEQFRTIRTNIHFTMVDRQLKSLVVTSAGRNAGKSLLSANLAAVFAGEDSRILLVDADLRKPTMHKTFQLQNQTGLTSLLREQKKRLAEITFETQIENLWLITSGPLPPNPAELLASKRMEVLKEEMEATFDLVIFDTPPLLPVTDAQVLASRVDGTVVVVPKGVVTKEELFKAKELLDIVGANVIGAVFNRVEATNNHYYYGED